MKGTAALGGWIPDEADLREEEAVVDEACDRGDERPPPELLKVARESREDRRKLLPDPRRFEPDFVGGPGATGGGATRGGRGGGEPPALGVNALTGTLDAEWVSFPVGSVGPP